MAEQTPEVIRNEDFPKLSHKKKKALVKKLKRKQKRQEEAYARNVFLEQEEEIKKKSPSYETELAEEEKQEELLRLQIEAESQRQHELWLWSEEVAAEKLRQKKEQEEREKQLKLEIERKIKEEWEERQKKEKEEEEEKKKRKEKQESLLKEARANENKEDGSWHNPIAPVTYGKERQIQSCPFFTKVGACRFGDRCSRAHQYPESSCVVLLPGMYSNFELEQGLCEEYDTDIILEYEEGELYNKFKEFYEDVLPEFKSIGRVTQFKVSCNYEPHLRGNVYVQYAREEDALTAFATFNARWYAGKQLSCQFITIPSWRSAVCGLYNKGTCPKGRTCNFLHVFKNPRNEFWEADRGYNTPGPPERSHRGYSHRNNHRRSRSRSPRRRRSRSRSQSKMQRSRRSRSKSCDRYHSHSRKRDANCHRSRSRSYERDSGHSRSRKRSRSNSRETSHAKDRSRSRSQERDHRNSRSRHRSRSYSRKRSNVRDRSRSRSLSPKQKKKKLQSNLEFDLNVALIDKEATDEVSNKVYEEEEHVTETSADAPPCVIKSDRNGRVNHSRDDADQWVEKTSLNKTGRDLDKSPHDRSRSRSRSQSSSRSPESSGKYRKHKHKKKHKKHKH